MRGFWLWAGALACLLLAHPTMGHGFLAQPKSRNVLHNTAYCPHCLNGGGINAVRSGSWPSGGRHGICGDPARGPRPHEAGGSSATGRVTGVYVEGGLIHLALGITTYHKGMVEYRICRHRAGSDADERRALTDDCLDEHRLVQADVSGAQNPGSRWYYLGNGPEAGYWPAKMFHHTFKLPDGLTCDGKEFKCVLQMHWITGNTCNDERLPAKYRLGHLRDCGDDGLWPEEFWNCADIEIVSRGSDAAGAVARRRRDDDRRHPSFSKAVVEGRKGNGSKGGRKGNGGGDDDDGHRRKGKGPKRCGRRCRRRRARRRQLRRERRRREQAKKNRG